MRIMYKEQPKIGGGGLTPLKIIFQKFGGGGWRPPSLQVGNPMAYILVQVHIIGVQKCVVYKS